ncbi:hypothetical protein LCGC14_2191970 [marine sediment metagenome]|uniref:Uncharacterized protein n=1 Tax=marine sediment metagenome TaxID=412755 RepID=A0A0F9GF70_9ZZZZ|nr:hypothetical protein [Candidatus Anoxychlamydiales bacterium]
MTLKAEPTPTIKTFAYTPLHLEYPARFLPIATTNSLEQRTFVRFTVTALGPICSISQDPFKIGEIIAVCNKCLGAFLARTLIRSFILSKNTVCPMGCGTVLNKAEIILSPLEKLRLQIDLIKDKIKLLEYQLSKRSEELIEILRSSKDDIKILDSIYDEDDSSSDEDAEVKELVLSIRASDTNNAERLTRDKEGEIGSLEGQIRELKTSLTPLLKKEREIVSAKESKQLTEYRHCLTKRVAIVSAFALLIFGSYKLLQNNFFCSLS